MPAVIVASPAPVFETPAAQAVQANATLTASGSTVLVGYGMTEVTLFINVKAAPTGTTPTLTYTVQEVDPGDGATVIGITASSTSITGVSIQKVVLPVVFSGSIKVSWTVTGTTPSFTQVYATMVGHSNTHQIVDASGNGPAAVKPASTAAVAADPAMVVAFSPNSGLPTGTSTIGVVNQGTPASVANSWTVEITDGTHGPAAVKAASTAAVAGDAALVTAFSPNSALPTGTNTIGVVNQGLSTTLANAWPHEITDGTHGPVAVKAASTAAVAGDAALVTAFSPNTGLPTGTNTIGVVNQGTATTLANAWPHEITDGTHGPVAVKAASTAAVAGDAALVTAFSPNTGLPTGTNTIGVVNQGTATTLANAWPHEITDGTHGPAAVKAASTAAVAADPALVTAFSPNSGLPTGTNTIGVINQGVGTATIGNAWFEKITDGTNGPVAVKPASTAPVLADPSLVVSVSPNQLATYSAAVTGLATATTATDIFTITGSATKTVTVTNIRVTGFQTTSSMEDILLVKRSSANSGGTSTAATGVPHDSNNAASTATVLSYTANPATPGTLVGTVRSSKLFVAVQTPSNAQSASPQIPLIWDFADRASQPPTLRGTSQVLAVNLNSTTVAGSSFDIHIEWTEGE